MRYLTQLEATLAKLVAFKSVSSNKEESKRLLDLVASEIGEHLHIERFESEGFPSLIATTRKTKTPKVFLAAHIDVVPGSDSLFTMHADDENLYGRGVMDMKCALACYLQLIKDLDEAVNNCDFGLMLTADEEIGGYNGTKVLVDKGYIPDVVFLPDGGYDWNIEEMAKGIVWIQATAEGKPAHGSRPWQGEDPFELLFAFLSDLKKEFVQEPCGDENHAHHTVTVGKVSGGAVFNQVAPSAEACIDIRFLPTTTKDEIEAMVHRVVAHHPKVSIAVVMSEPASKSDITHPAIQKWQHILKTTYGHASAFKLAHGGSDARFFDGTGATVFITEPMCGDFHTEEEWMSRRSLAEFYEVMKKWVVEVSGK